MAETGVYRTFQLVGSKLATLAISLVQRIALHVTHAIEAHTAHVAGEATDRAVVSVVRSLNEVSARQIHIDPILLYGQLEVVVGVHHLLLDLLGRRPWMKGLG